MRQPPKSPTSVTKAQRPAPSRRAFDMASARTKKKNKKAGDVGGNVGAAAKVRRRASLSALSAAPYTPLLANLAWPAGEQTVDDTDGSSDRSDHKKRVPPRSADAGRNGVGNTSFAQFLEFLGNSDSDDELFEFSGRSMASSRGRSPPANFRRLTIGMGISDVLGVARRADTPPGPSSAGDREDSATAVLQAQYRRSDFAIGESRPRSTNSNGLTIGFRQSKESARRYHMSPEVVCDEHPFPLDEGLEEIAQPNWTNTFPEKILEDIEERECEVAALRVPESGAETLSVREDAGTQLDPAVPDDNQAANHAQSYQSPPSAVESNPRGAQAPLDRRNTTSVDRIPQRSPRLTPARTVASSHCVVPAESNSTVSSNHSSPRARRSNEHTIGKARLSKVDGNWPSPRSSRTKPTPEPTNTVVTNASSPRTTRGLPFLAKSTQTVSPLMPRSPEPCPRCRRYESERHDAAELRVELEIARGQANAHREFAEEAKREAAMAAREETKAELREVLEKAEALKKEAEAVRYGALHADARLAKLHEELKREREASERCEVLYEEAFERQREERAEKDRLTKEVELARERIYFLEEELHGLQEKEETDIDMLTRALEQVGKQRDDLAANLREEEQKTARLENEVNDLLQKVEDVNKRNCLMKDEVVRKEHDSHAETEVKLLQARLEDAVRELEQFRKRYEHTENQNRVYRTTIQQLLDSKAVSEGRPSSAGSYRSADQVQSPMMPASSELPDAMGGYSGHHLHHASISRSSTVSVPSSSFRHSVSGSGPGVSDPIRARQAWQEARSSAVPSSTASQADPGSPQSAPPRSAPPMAASLSTAVSSTGLDDYMQAARDLEAQLREYTRDKEKLQAEFARIPLNGGALARRRQAGVEARLDEVDRNLARVKLKMRSMHVM